MPKYNDETFLEIDQYRLVDEWVDQPSRYNHYARELANARREVDEAKAELELTKAEVAADIRAAPENYGMAKATEASVAECSITQRPYKLALATYNDARHKVGLLEAAVEGLQQRKRALEKIVDLHGQQYWAQPKAKGEEAKEVLETAEKRAIRGRKRPREEDVD